MKHITVPMDILRNIGQR